MIQDIEPHVFDNQYSNATSPSADDLVIITDGREVILSDSENFAFPKIGDFEALDNVTYLFSIDDVRYFTSLSFGERVEAPQGYSYRNLMIMREQAFEPKESIFAAHTGKHLIDWYRDNQRCGRCGLPMSHSETERALKCSCGYTCYPRIMPAVIVAVTNGDEILLTKYAAGFKYSALVAGFMEIGETFEETVRREVMEEVGIEVKNIRYYKSQPWGIANDILAGFFCDVDGSTEITLDDNELGYAAWTKREDILLHPDDLSLTNEMMALFKNGGNC